jgi:glycosyltransferase involved in cell wall biosynthesis
MPQEKKRVAIIINTLRVGGGAERVAAYVADGLKGQGHQVAFLLFDDSGSKYVSDADVFLIGNGQAPRSSLQALAFMFKRAKAIAAFCKENGIDTCLGFMEEANFSAVISKLFFGNRAKVVCSLRNNPEKKKPVAKRLIRILYARADAVVANSLALADIARRRFGLKRTSVVYNPVAYDRIADLKDKPLPRECEPFFVGGKTFLNIGRLTAQKGQKTLLAAFRQVAERSPEARLAIIGEGELLKDLVKAASDAGLSDKVFFLGRQENVFPFLKAAAAFVLASEWEGMPNAILESLAVGVPVVSTDCPTGPREIIAPAVSPSSWPLETERGILVETGNAAMLAEAMLKAAARGRKEFIDERFLPDNVIKEWEKII